MAFNLSVEVNKFVNKETRSSLQSNCKANVLRARERNQVLSQYTNNSPRLEM
jgi:hypothetical protein